MHARNLTLGATAGLAGGLIFGVMMGAMGMLPMSGKMVGHPSALAGFVRFDHRLADGTFPATAWGLPRVFASARDAN